MAVARRRVVCAGVVIAALVSGLTAAQPSPQLSRTDADSLQRKLTAIVARGTTPPKGRSAAPIRTSLTEREINAYLKFSARDQLPTGVMNPQLSLTGARRVTGQAMVDLDAVRTAKERSWLDPAAYLTGRVELQAAGLLDSAAGKATFQLESATVGGVPIPKSVFNELVTYYSRTPDLPAGLDLDKPFDLPANIREVQIQRGAATIVQ